MKLLRENSLKFAKIFLGAYFVLYVGGVLLYCVGCYNQIGIAINPISYIRYDYYERMLIPTILLMVYLLKDCRSFKSHLILLISYIFLGISQICVAIHCIVEYKTYYFYYDFAPEFLCSSDFLLSRPFVLTTSALIGSISLFIHVVFAAINIIRGFKHNINTKVFLMIYSALKIIVILLNIYPYLEWTGATSIGIVIKNLSSFFMIFTYLIFWFFIIKRNEPEIKVVINKNESIEDKLVTLKNLYDSGAITEEEYTAKKTEILNQL